MNFLEYYYNRTLKYDLINKFCYTNIKKIPKLKKVVLNFGCKTTDIKKLATSLLALELISNKKGVLRKSKSPNLALKIKKGHPTGCVVTLDKKTSLKFLAKVSLEILTAKKQFNGLNILYKTNSLSYTIKNSFNFSCFKDQYYLFSNLSNLNISVITINSKKEETLFILKSLQFPLNNKNINKQI